MADKPIRLGPQQVQTLVSASKERVWIDKIYGPVRQYPFGAVEKVQPRQINRLQELGLLRKGPWVQSRMLTVPTRAGLEWIENNPHRIEEDQ